MPLNSSDNTRYNRDDEIKMIMMGREPERAPLDTLQPPVIRPNIQPNKKPGLYEMRRDQLAKQGNAMLEMTDMENYLKAAGMNPEIAELIGLTGLATTPMAVGSMDDILRMFKKLSKKDVDDILKSSTLKSTTKSVQPNKPNVENTYTIMDTKAKLKPYKPKPERQLDSARARLYDVLLDEEDWKVDVKPYVKPAGK
jgi:hypothetical protein